MQIPDCYDPVTQEERRQAEYDARLEGSPRCDACGGSLYPHDTYTEIGDHVYCEECVTKGTRSVDDLEVFW